MSEFQYVAFRAVDRPVDEKNLEFMRQQSSRAEITPWSFDNEYHYSDFRGNAKEMLRRGYDLHLHYANFGYRTLMIHLPQGLPDFDIAKRYFLSDGLNLINDRQGVGGILAIDPFFESGELEEIWEPAAIFERLLPLRAEILDGDLRPLYLAHLAVAGDGNHDPDEEQEGPVPAGLQQLTPAQEALAEFYGLGEDLLTAASKNSPPLPKNDRKHTSSLTDWLQRQPEAKKDAWLASWMADANASTRHELLVQYRKDCPSPAWPTISSDRTIAELLQATDECARIAEQKAADKAARARKKRLATMKANPEKTLQETSRLVAQRSGDAYRTIAGQLAELREALAGTERFDLADQHAQTLRQDNPTLSRLVSELRKQGFLPK